VAFVVSPDDPDPVRAQYAAVLTPPDADFRAHGVSVFFNQIVSRKVAVFADEQYVTRDATLLDRHDNQVRLGVNYIHPRGIFARVTTSFMHQSFSNTPIVGLSNGSFSVTDASVQYEFARKHGLLSWTATNLFNQQFQTVIEDLTVTSPLPYRAMVLSLRWRL
jgi:hypothetical protein